MYPIFTCWHPELTGAGLQTILAHPITHAQAVDTVAAEHGFVASEVPEHTYLDATFERAVDALVHGRLPELADLLKAHPRLATATSGYGHRATLLHYVGANGVETWRQLVPGNAPEIAKLLIAHGAEVDAHANIYGGTTPLALLVSSDHTRASGCLTRLEQTFVAAGVTGDALHVTSTGCQPLLGCADLTLLMTALCTGLGFSMAWAFGDPPSDAVVRLDRTELQLTTDAHGPRGVWVIVMVDDVDAFNKRVKRDLVSVLTEPDNQPWGQREMLLRLPGEHVLRVVGPLA